MKFLDWMFGLSATDFSDDLPSNALGALPTSTAAPQWDRSAPRHDCEGCKYLNTNGAFYLQCAVHPIAPNMGEDRRCRDWESDRMH